LASGPVKILPGYLFPFRPPNPSNLSVGLSGRLIFVMAMYLNTNHIDWKPRLTTSGRFLPEYSSESSSLVYKPDTNLTIHYNSIAIHDKMEIILINELVTSLYVTTNSTKSPKH
jgi:hypothetical protein